MSTITVLYVVSTNTNDFYLSLISLEIITTIIYQLALFISYKYVNKTGLRFKLEYWNSLQVEPVT